MHRFFTDPNHIGENTLTIEGEDRHHILRVLRIGANEIFEVCDGQGMDHHCIIDSDDGKALTCKIVGSMPSAGEGAITYTLYQGLPKGTKMDEVVQKTTELGITRVCPFVSRRTVMDLKDKAAKKTERWQKIAYSAAKQSKRGIIPQVECPISFDKMLDELKGGYDLVIFCYEEEQETALKQALEAYEGTPKTVAFIIGPEGGMASDEAKALKVIGACSVSLGKRILRTETAGMAVLAQLNFFFGV